MRSPAAVVAEQPAPTEFSIVWRTHTLCWAAESCLGISGDYVECGSYRGYSMAVMLRYLDGLPGRQCWPYDLFDPTGSDGEGHRLHAHGPNCSSGCRRALLSAPMSTMSALAG